MTIAVVIFIFSCNLFAIWLTANLFYRIGYRNGERRVLEDWSEWMEGFIKGTDKEQEAKQ